jgi:hypothetical protein
VVKVNLSPVEGGVTIGTGSFVVSAGCRMTLQTFGLAHVVKDSSGPVGNVMAVLAGTIIVGRGCGVTLCA